MTRHQKLKGRILIMFIAMFFGAAANAELTLGIHPFKPPSTLIKSFTPLAEYLSHKLNEPVSIKISKDYQTHIDSVGQDKFDLAYMGPAPYVQMVQAYGQKPLLARQVINGSPVFHGKIFVRKDSAIQSIEELKGKRFAFGDHNSTMSHLVPRFMLWQAGVRGEQLASFKHVSDHMNIALAVLAGDFDAGAVKEDVFFAQEQRGLRAIATSPPIFDHPFVASKRLPAEKVEALRNALLNVANEPNGKEILQAMTPGVTALVPAANQDYDNLRGILNKLKELGINP